jgi:hypothetical protein
LLAELAAAGAAGLATRVLRERRGETRHFQEQDLQQSPPSVVLAAAAVLRRQLLPERDWAAEDQTDLEQAQAEVLDTLMGLLLALQPTKGQL